MLSEFIRTADQLHQLLTALRAPDWDKPLYYASLGAAPMRLRPDLWIQGRFTAGTSAPGLSRKHNCPKRAYPF